MRILICTALFPPDVADPAPYIKELSARLSTQHEVSVLAYGSIPETVPGVRILTIKKSSPAPWRLVKFAYQLIKSGFKNDVVLVGNGPSTELPLVLVGWFIRRKLRLQISDTKITYRGYRRFIHQAARLIAVQVIDTKLPTSKPERLPFSDLSNETIKQYEASWSIHLNELQENL